jgi:GNAT superfamily N-acetyltransferase
LKLSKASEADAKAIATVRSAAAQKLTSDFGKGHWSSLTHEAGALRDLKTSTVVVARDGRNVVGTLTLATKKPWAIDVAYFAPCQNPLYLINMAVAPERQRIGIGRALLAEAGRVARRLKADAIRLDSYDAPAGAGGFYARCGYREAGRTRYRGVPLVYFEWMTGAVK